MNFTVNILGTRGIPAQHGGFETFAERLSLYLSSRGVSVNVYCQDDDASFADGYQDLWRGITRTHLRPIRSGSMGTLTFDLKAVRHVLSQPGVDLVLGYNSALFTILQRIRGRRVIMNMDGIEWQRSKWRAAAKAWFYINEALGLSLSHVAIADHPEIAAHLSKRSRLLPIMIPYGADAIGSADAAHLKPYQLTLDRFFVSIARIEPENSILELVRASRSLPNDYKAVFLGRIDEANPYHRSVKAEADHRTIFPGAVYDQDVVRALRFFARAYLHGHQVGGTNPSLVEALGAGNPVLAHANRFNRWTAGPAQAYFSDVQSASALMLAYCQDDALIHKARAAAKARHAELFTWDKILRAYEAVLQAQATAK